MTGPFISPGEASLMDATARLAAVQRLLKELQELTAAMELGAVDVDKHLEYIEGRIHEMDKEINRLGLAGPTTTRAGRKASGGSK